MTGSRYDIGLLELPRLLIRDQPAREAGVESYTLFDPHTQQQVGIARAEPGWIARLLGWSVRSPLLPARLRVYETDEESLVFTIRRAAGLWGQRSEIYDADDHLIGYGESSVYSGQSGFQLYDRSGFFIANTDGDLRGPHFRLQSREGRELGTVTRGAGASHELGVESGSSLVTLHEDLVDQPLMKMLLLGAILTIGMAYYTKNK